MSEMFHKPAPGGGRLIPGCERQLWLTDFLGLISHVFVPGRFYFPLVRFTAQVLKSFRFSRSCWMSLAVVPPQYRPQTFENLHTKAQANTTPTHRHNVRTTNIHSTGWVFNVTFKLWYWGKEVWFYSGYSLRIWLNLVGSVSIIIVVIIINYSSSLNLKYFAS